MSHVRGFVHLRRASWVTVWCGSLLGVWLCIALWGMTQHPPFYSFSIGPVPRFPGRSGIVNVKIALGV